MAFYHMKCCFRSTTIYSFTVSSRSPLIFFFNCRPLYCMLNLFTYICHVLLLCEFHFGVRHWAYGYSSIGCAPLDSDTPTPGATQSEPRFRMRHFLYRENSALICFGMKEMCSNIYSEMLSARKVIKSWGLLIHNNRLNF